MNSALANTRRRTCLKCGFIGDTTEAKCPACGGLMRATSTIRILGVVMIALGGFLITTMAVISLWAYNLIQQSSAPGTSARFTGTKNQMLMMFGVFGLVTLFGVVALVTGLWQLIFGKRNKLLTWVVLGLGAVFVIGGLAFNTFFSR
jgi:hypothetical protein